MTRSPRELLQRRLDQTRGIGLGDRWLDISKHRGDPKAATFAHSERENRESGEAPDGYYGVYATGEDPLVILDIDDYGDSGADTDGLAAIALKLARENETFTVESPHGGEHMYYRVVTDGYAPIASVLNDRLGTANPTPSWGELTVANRYVVGPGTTLTDCTKDHEHLDTPACDTAEGGEYSIKNDPGKIASITAEDLCYVLRQDSEIEDAGHNPDQETLNESNGGASAETVRERVEVAREHDDSGIIDDVLNGRYAAAGYTNQDGSEDRSAAECALASKLGFWLGEVSDVREAFETVYDRGKWAERGDDYHQTVLEYADVGETFDWEGDSEPPASQMSADGGADTQAPQPEPATEAPESPTVEESDDESGDEWPLSMAGLMKKAFADPYGRLNRRADPDKPDPTPHDLKKNEAATYIWRLLDERDEQDVLYASNEQFYAYDNGVWVSDGDAGEQRLREVGREVADVTWSTQLKRELKEEVRARNGYHVDELGINAPWLVTQNGVLNLKTREMRDVSKDDRALRRINTDFDADAEPDKWLDFIAEITTSPGAIRKLQEYLGYTLWHHGQPFGKALFLTGATDSGKGTTLQVVREILGESSVSNESLSDLVDTTWGPAQLYGRAANIADEVTADALEGQDMFKTLTGGEDAISAQFKNDNKFEFVVTQKFLFATNQFPQVEDADRAFWNRCLFVRMPETVPPEEQNPNLVEDLLEESAGILNWMLDGLERLFEQGQFSDERAIDAKKGIAEEIGSPLERFKQEAITITRQETDVVHAEDLHSAVTALAEAQDLSGVPSWQGGAFTSEVKAYPGIGTTETRRLDGSGQERAFCGIQVDPEVVERLGVDVRQDSQDSVRQTGL